MKLEETASKKLYQYLDHNINEYSAGNFDFNDFFQTLTNLITSSENWRKFTDIAQGDLAEYLNDNTERFVEDLEKFFVANFGKDFLDGKEVNMNDGSDHSSNKDDGEDKMEEEEEGNGVYDNFDSDEDLYAEKNYRKERDIKIRAEEESDEDVRHSPKKYVNKNQQSRNVVGEGRNMQHSQNRDKHGPPPQPQTFRFNKNGGQQQPPPYQSYPPQPDSQMTKPGAPHYKGEPPKMPPTGIPTMPGGTQPMMPGGSQPMMPGGSQPMMPYPYPYPDYRPYPMMYPPMPYPHQMSMMPPVNMYHPMDPHHVKPPMISTEYDPLVSGTKIPPPEIVKPSKPTTDPKPSTPTNKAREPPKKLENLPSPDEEKKSHHHQQHSKPPREKTPTNRHPKSHGGDKSSEHSFVEARNIVYVKNIPSYYNTVDVVSKFFKRFGSIVNVKVDYSRKMAQVEFQKEAEAAKALANRKPLFGDKNIFIAKNPDATGPETSTNGKGAGGEDSSAAATLKLNESLTEKLKFLISMRSIILDSDKKAELMNRINEIKEAQKTNKVSEITHKLLDSESYNLKFDDTLLVSEIPKEVLETKSLNSKLEKYGKIEKLKINPKDLTAELKYYSADSARKALMEVTEMKLKFAKEEANQLMQKIKQFEDTFLTSKVQSLSLQGDDAF